jgi:hypothetical protein
MLEGHKKNESTLLAKVISWLGMPPNLAKQSRTKAFLEQESTPLVSNQLRPNEVTTTMVDNLFEQLKSHLYQKCDLLRIEDGAITRPLFYREAGQFAEKRRYFYIKAHGDTGWLFERSGPGWVVSRAEKISTQNLFLRRGEPWDVVSIFQSEPDYRAKIASLRWGGDFISPIVYQNYLAKALNLKLESP